MLCNCRNRCTNSWLKWAHEGILVCDARESVNYDTWRHRYFIAVVVLLHGWFHGGKTLELRYRRIGKRNRNQGIPVPGYHNDVRRAVCLGILRTPQWWLLHWFGVSDVALICCDQHLCRVVHQNCGFTTCPLLSWASAEKCGDESHPSQFQNYDVLRAVKYVKLFTRTYGTCIEHVNNVSKIRKLFHFCCTFASCFGRSQIHFDIEACLMPNNSKITARKFNNKIIVTFLKNFPFSLMHTLHPSFN